MALNGAYQRMFYMCFSSFLVCVHVFRFCRVLIVDFDVHHGDGVQEAFYEDPRYSDIGFFLRGVSWDLQYYSFLHSSINWLRDYLIF